MNYTFNYEEVRTFVSPLIGHWEWEKATGLGILDNNGKMVAGVIVNNYEKNARCSIHCAGIGKRWLTKEFLFLVFDYVFNQLHCNIVINWVDENKIQAVNFTKHIGFKTEFVIADACANSNLVILTYRKADCKWILNEKFIRKYYALRPLHHAAPQGIQSTGTPPSDA